MIRRITAYIKKIKIAPASSDFIVFMLLLGAVAVLGHKSVESEWRNEQVFRDLSRLEAEQKTTAEKVSAALSLLEEKLNLTKSEQEALRSGLLSERQRSGALEKQLGQVSGTVETLEKLTNTDEELLQKYSKVYFLNEHYIPARFSRIDPKRVYQPDRPRDLQIHTSVLPYLDALLKAAEQGGAGMLVASAYRSFGIQEELKSQYVVVYGAGTANQFSADQGYSEHQLGTTVDFTTAKTGASWDAFEKTAAFTWLVKNAHMYGFTLSYSKNNSYYQYEPWHWRFVGKELALRLHNEKKYFYDLDQREIDKYLVSIFD